ncbi:MAG: Endonuclease V [Candidatus Gottesmanbacteria bacterium GW2011_GWC2_39_8]|uniref:Endonuclease V n=1 Tax=Candidatus Gottesmanbacteria bacterium GW2011_GWC2_39_8 TaxID=1618450 RepID=A0A0G0T5R4_9BACT|nr:MAG: Endonuclease V [Candidatus Gottesmanbacteria bacterium GW2011_GWC2_39_8]
MTFKDLVYTVTKKIPRGKVATYGQIARLTGSPKAARAVGMCMKTNPDAPRTPCHRVVASDGSLTGYSGGNGISTKKEMLLAEGVKFDKEKVNLSLSKWKV